MEKSQKTGESLMLALFSRREASVNYCKASNYHPVSLTSQVSKIYEFIVRDAIMEHLVKNQLITDSQSWFFERTIMFE